MPHVVRWLLDLLRPRRTSPVPVPLHEVRAEARPTRTGAPRTIDADAERRYELPLDFFR